MKALPPSRMGNFYTNFEIFGGEAGDVLRVAKELRRWAFVVAPKGRSQRQDKATKSQLGEDEALSG